MPVVKPPDACVFDLDVGHFGYVDDLWVFFVDCVAFGLYLNTIFKQRHGFFEREQTVEFVGVRFCVNVIGHDGARECDCTTGMLFFG